VPKLLTKVEQLYELKVVQALVTARGNRVDAAYNLGLSVQQLRRILYNRDHRLLAQAKAEGWKAPDDIEWC
jgi:hypothetical protein